MPGNTDLAKLISDVKNLLDGLEKDKPKTETEKKLFKVAVSIYIISIGIVMMIISPKVIHINDECEELKDLKKKLEKIKETL